MSSDSFAEILEYSKGRLSEGQYIQMARMLQRLYERGNAEQNSNIYMVHLDDTRHEFKKIDDDVYGMHEHDMQVFMRSLSGLLVEKIILTTVKNTLEDKMKKLERSLKYVGMYSTLCRTMFVIIIGFNTASLLLRTMMESQIYVFNFLILLFSIFGLALQVN